MPSQRHGKSSPDRSPVSPIDDYAKKYRPGMGGKESPVSPIGFDDPRASQASSLWGPLAGKPSRSRPPTVQDVRHYQPTIQNYSKPISGKPAPADYSVHGPYDSSAKRPVTKFPTPYAYGELPPLPPAQPNSRLSRPADLPYGREPSPPRSQLKSRLSRPIDDPVTAFPGAEYAPPPPVPRLPPHVYPALPPHLDQARQPRGQSRPDPSPRDKPDPPRQHPRAEGDAENRRRHHHHHHPDAAKTPKDTRTPFQKISQAPSFADAKQQWRNEYEWTPWVQTVLDGGKKVSKNAREIKAAVLPDKSKSFTYNVGAEKWTNPKFK